MIGTAALAAVLLGIALAVPDLRDALSRLTHVSAGWLALALALEVGSCLGYVAVVRLVLRRAPAREARWLAWAEMAFGAVVPVGGAGGLAVGAWALRGWGLSWSRIANRSAVIFLLTSAVNTAVLAIAGLGVWLGIGTHRGGVVYGLLPGGIALAGLTIVCALPFVHIPTRRTRRLGRGLGTLAGWVRDSEALLLTRDTRLLGAPAYLLLDIAVLWACLRAVGTSPPVLALVLGYQLGYLANLIPIPGGIGVLEGGLLGALLLYGLPATQTAAGIVLYHAIAVWVPALGGTIGFARLRGSVSPRGRRLATADRDAAPDSLEPGRKLAA